MKRIYYFSFLLFIFSILGCDEGNKTKELELKARELELKEKELQLASNAKEKVQEASETVQTSSTNTNSSTTGTIDNYSYSDYGTITGDKVIIRASYSTKSKNKGNFYKGESVEILDEYYPTNDREAISRKQIHLYDNYGRVAYTLVSGKAVEVLSQSNNKYNVRFVHPDYGKLTATVNASDLEFISGDKWYHVRRNNGQTGWVFSKFLRR